MPIDLQNLSAVLDSLSVCKPTGFAIKEGCHVRLLSAVWGETVEPRESPVMVAEPAPAGPSAGQAVDLPPLLDEYHVSRSWNARGRQSPPELVCLGLTGA